MFALILLGYGIAVAVALCPARPLAISPRPPLAGAGGREMGEE